MLSSHTDWTAVCMYYVHSNVTSFVNVMFVKTEIDAYRRCMSSFLCLIHPFNSIYFKKHKIRTWYLFLTLGNNLIIICYALTLIIIFLFLLKFTCYLLSKILFVLFTGGPYSAFGGRDASRGLATFSVTASDKEGYDDLSDLNSMEMDSVKEWAMQFKGKYNWCLCLRIN